MLNFMISNLQPRATGKHPWLGRMAICKVDILPRFLYLYQTLPIDLPQAFFWSLGSSLLGNLWPNSPARLCYDILVKWTTKGGSRFTAYGTLLCSSSIDQNIGLVSLWANTTMGSHCTANNSYSFDLSLPWIVPKSRPSRHTLSPLTQYLLRVWDWTI